MDSLLSTGWLAEHLGDPDLRLVDASAHPLDPARDAAAEFAGGHIPGARFLDLATLIDADHPAPGMAPDAAAFAARLGGLGIARRDRIVLYDDASHHTACRAWWLLRRFGAEHVAILDGGLAKWRAEGRLIEQGRSGVTPVAFALGQPLTGVRDLEQMRANLDSRAEQVVDARSPARFSGVEADPRTGVAPGHIPGSTNLRYDALLNPDRTWKSPAELRAAFETAGVDLARPIVTTCGSGVTAAILLFGLHLLGLDDAALYDGSWSEWGADATTPKATA
ncbi:3-mercaptopyruvate sulfurtransferase [Sphingomonas jatrophae]|uniref:Sulfurtransferase n=1 Tax=Sphingomonas jatrophae TaxID=1166337 RepID=A0A1I6LCN2_9SPHN|nr:3-mercaptopyruvate sulfurtransferase [Sphingomonas jatrophae]SFS01232.1 thiosulfate/3-mercaptopyruvate sulfurtransferase [Sphingomonas jatrophae]